MDKKLIIGLIIIAVVLIILAVLFTTPQHKIFMTLGMDICSGSDGDCYLDYAAETGDADICDHYLTEKNSIRRCYVYSSARTKDLSVCMRFENEVDVTDCYSESAVFSKDPVYCRKIAELYSENEFCYSHIVRQTGDSALCDELSESNRDTCSFDAMIFNVTATNDISICDNLPDDFYFGSGKDQCYTQVAWGKDDSSLCDNVVSEQFKESCLNEFE